MKILVTGNCYFRKDLEKMAGDRVRFFDGLPDGKRRELLKMAWVLVNPSVRDGFGLNVIEANALEYSRSFSWDKTVTNS